MPTRHIQNGCSTKATNGKHSVSKRVQDLGVTPAGYGTEAEMNLMTCEDHSRRKSPDQHLMGKRREAGQARIAGSLVRNCSSQGMRASTRMALRSCAPLWKPVLECALAQSPDNACRISARRRRRQRCVPELSRRPFGEAPPATFPHALPRPAPHERLIGPADGRLPGRVLHLGLSHLFSASSKDITFNLSKAHVGAQRCPMHTPPLVPTVLA